MDYEIMMNNNLKIGMEAPDFDAVSTMGDISLSSYKGKWIVFFSHPNDFSPICTTEIIGLAKADTYFKKINTDKRLFSLYLYFIKSPVHFVNHFF